MRKKLSIILAALVVSTTGIMAKDIKTITVTTHPQMHCSGCETRIKNFLKFEKGIKKIETNVKDQRVTVTYDADKTSEETIIDTFYKNNYEVKKVYNDASTAKKNDTKLHNNVP